VGRTKIYAKLKSLRFFVWRGVGSDLCIIFLTAKRFSNCSDHNPLFPLKNSQIVGGRASDGVGHGRGSELGLEHFLTSELHVFRHIIHSHLSANRSEQMSLQHRLDAQHTAHQRLTHSGHMAEDQQTLHMIRCEH
jgi:hypothetical protein